MNEQFVNARYFTTDCKNYLAKFLRADQYLTMSDWGKNSWFHILKNSYMARIAENTACDISGVEHIGPCTIAIYKQGTDLVMIIADKVGFAKVGLHQLNGRSLERLAAKLVWKMMGPAIYSDEKEYAKQQCIFGELECLDKKDLPLYLAGV